jgi:hypothetical protein
MDKHERWRFPPRASRRKARLEKPIG